MSRQPPLQWEVKRSSPLPSGPLEGYGSIDRDFRLSEQIHVRPTSHRRRGTLRRRLRCPPDPATQETIGIDPTTIKTFDAPPGFRSVVTSEIRSSLWKPRDNLLSRI